ncbi:probable ethanolamine kinase isoform X1 [Tanacetum coccineum]
MSRLKMAAEIAKQLKNFHQVDVPGSKEPQLWTDIIKFLESASTLTFDDGEKHKLYMKITYLNAPVVFAHNDLHSGNLMLNDDERKLYFLDFEYGSYSYRGFNIGNHFNENAGYDCDYKLYPSKNEQYHFFRHYLNPENPNEVSDNDLEALYVEANCYHAGFTLVWVKSMNRLSKEPIPKELLEWYGYDIVEDYLPVAKKPIPKVIFKSPIPNKGCVLRLANVETWDKNIE